MATESSVLARRGCSPYPPQTLYRFQKMLVDRRKELLHSCAGLSHVAMKKAGARSEDDSQVTDDPADLAAGTCEQEISLSMLGRLQADLEEIRSALESIDDRTYGSCVQCGKPIPEARLEALPAADTCVPCKAAQEAA